MKYIIVTLLTLFFSFPVFSQELTVKSFEPAPMDLTATTNPVTDLYGWKCALIKVECVLPNMKFKGNVIGEPKYENGEYWVYSSDGTTLLTIKPQQFPSFQVNIPKYIGSALKAGVTYKLIINVSQDLYNRSILINMANNEHKKAIIENLIDNMVFVDGGTFTMGADIKKGNDNNEYPTHEETLSSFKIGRYEVTQEEWGAVMGTKSTYIKDLKEPVVNISWNDCIAFINKLNEITGKKFRLPTEAEWEYAARGGNKSCGYRYSGSDSLELVGWYNGNGSTSRYIGNKKPNELGLYDMSGNVREWCQDNFTTLDFLHIKVTRGGSWNETEAPCRVSYRECQMQDKSDSFTGFRLAL